ncbi:hypothetical protein DPMN_086779 [Dreissena polymorpha]|uniref:VWFD domain-containing protein n=2 Tax=Dreissena polymorpha TaxID=45954 RepID=A0A9D4KRI3_DREPO|nr:hypothetical protein DPMN_086779 [Dreissena polymorpha]
MQLEGEFIMYKHKQYPVEVQIETESCNGGWASCTCGVAIRAGRDLFVVNHCHGGHIVEAVNTSDGVLKGVLHSSYSQTFHLPYGTSIEVYYFVTQWWSPMNIYIYPSPNDMNNVEGLCGLFNGNWRDDFLHRDGAMTLSYNYYWWWWWWGGDPDKFSKSWIVPDAESLLNPERIANLSSWNEDERFCICPKDNGGNREPTCHQNEADWCSQFEDNPGSNFGTLTSDRTKRSIPFVDNHDTVERLTTLKNIRTFKRTVVRVKRQVSVSNDSYEKAVAECQAYLTANCNGEEAALASSVAGNASNDCAQDKMVDGSSSSSAASESACISTQSVAKQVVERDIELQVAYPNIAQTFKTACIDNCYGNGNCTETGDCKCFEGFDPLSNCKVNVSEPPEIISTTGGGICNPKLKPCETLRYTTRDGCSKKSICKVIAKDFYISGKKVTHETTFISAICNNGWDAYCSISLENRRKRSSDPVVATEFNTAISNNNVSYSRATKVSVLDTTCLSRRCTAEFGILSYRWSVCPFWWKGS